MSMFKWGQGVGGRIGLPRPVRRRRTSGRASMSGDVFDDAPRPRRRRMRRSRRVSRAPTPAQLRARKLFAQRARAGEFRRQSRR
jgi:hypothetical protein